MESADIFNGEYATKGKRTNEQLLTHGKQDDSKLG